MNKVALNGLRLKYKIFVMCQSGPVRSYHGRKKLFAQVIESLQMSNRARCVVYVEQRKQKRAHYFSITLCGNNMFLLGQTNAEDYSIAESLTNGMSHFLSTSNTRSYLCDKDEVIFSTKKRTYNGTKHREFVG